MSCIGDCLDVSLFMSTAPFSGSWGAVHVEQTKERYRGGGSGGVARRPPAGPRVRGDGRPATPPRAWPRIDIARDLSAYAPASPAICLPRRLGLVCT